MTATQDIQLIDVREIPPYQRHSLIFATFGALPVGGALELLNDHDPRPLQGQFQARAPGGFSWTYIQHGPEIWQVRITKIADVTPSAGSCCGGGCGG